MCDTQWKDALLGDLADVNPEALGASTPFRWKFRYIDITSVANRRVNWIAVPEYEYRAAPSRARRVVRPGDTLFSTVRPSLQAHVCADWDMQEGIVCSTGFAVLRPRRLEARFLFHTVFSEAVQEQVRRREVGSSYPAVGESDLRLIQLRVPESPAEQGRIGEILNLLDAGIREAESAIAKLRQIKSGLMHSLLTYGLDGEGRIRDPIRDPEQFQSSPLGKIPCGWTVTKLGDLLRENGGFLQTGPFGSQLHSYEYVTQGVSVVMPQDIREDGTVDYIGTSKITEDRALALARHRLRQGDVLFARRGDLSRCCAVPGGNAAICGTGCLLLRPPSKAILAEWFVAAYRHDLCQRQIARKAVGTTMVNLNTKLLSDLLLCVPPIDEQERIVERFKSFEERRAIEETSLAKLLALKRGLAHDLLTGRVRVKI